jgi:hypothetical protein
MSFSAWVVLLVLLKDDDDQTDRDDQINGKGDPIRHGRVGVLCHLRWSPLVVRPSLLSLNIPQKIIRATPNRASPEQKNDAKTIHFNIVRNKNKTHIDIPRRRLFLAEPRLNLHDQRIRGGIRGSISPVAKSSNGRHDLAVPTRNSFIQLKIVHCGNQLLALAHIPPPMWFDVGDGGASFPSPTTCPGVTTDQSYRRGSST